MEPKIIREKISKEELARMTSAGLRVFEKESAAQHATW